MWRSVSDFHRYDKIDYLETVLMNIFQNLSSFLFCKYISTTLYILQTYQVYYVNIPNKLGFVSRGCFLDEIFSLFNLVTFLVTKIFQKTGFNYWY